MNIDSTGLRNFPTVSPEAAAFLASERQVYGVGVDTATPDTRQPNPAHRELSKKNVYILENVAQLQHVPPTGALAVVAPMKLSKAGGAPARVFAILP